MTLSSQKWYSDGQFRILHWNIHSWRDDAGASNLEAVVDLVRATDPHVVSLVEADEAWGVSSALTELGNRCEYASIFVPAFEFGGHEPAGGFGNAILTKVPILAIRHRQLIWPPRIYDGSEPSEPRSVVFAKLGSSSESLWIGSTHLPRGDASIRADAFRHLANVTEQLDGPWMLCGDFNTPATSWLDNYPLLTVCPYPAQPTYPTSEPVEAIDYCVASQGISMEAKVLSVAGSDHLPIFVAARGGGVGTPSWR